MTHTQASDVSAPAVSTPGSFLKPVRQTEASSPTRRELVALVHVSVVYGSLFSMGEQSSQMAFESTPHAAASNCTSEHVLQALHVSGVATHICTQQPESR